MTIRQSSEQVNAIKLIVIGRASAGKSAFIQRIITGGFNSEIKPITQLDFPVKKFIHGYNEISIQFFEFGVSGIIIDKLPHYCQLTNGAIVMFDLNYKKDYKKIQKWVNIFRTFIRTDAPFIIVGNKLDLIEPDYLERKRKKIQRYAQELDASYFETSVKTGYNIAAAFNALISIILKKFKGEQITHKQYQDDDGDDYVDDNFPYPYIFKPPEPPDDFAMAPQVLIRTPLKEKNPEEEISCQYCGMKLTKEEKSTHSCKKKPKSI